MTALTPDPRLAAAPTHHRGHTLLGIVLVVAGVLLLLSRAGVVVSPWPALPALLLAIAGVAIAIEGLQGRWNGTLIGLAVVLTIIAGVSTTATNSWDATSGGVGDRAYTPQSVADMQERYELGAGSLQLDLRQLDIPQGTTQLAVDVGMGEIQVRVPEGVAVGVQADSGTGEVVFFGDQQGGLGIDRTYETPGYADADQRLDLDLSVGLGRIEVTR
jgi:predicted membrane protein